MELQNKVAVITGAASGIGRGLAIALADKGCNLVLSDIASEKLEQLQSQVSTKVIIAGCDVTNTDSVSELVQTAYDNFESVDLVFANAGVMPTPVPMLDMSKEDLQWVFDVNVFGTWHVVQAFGKKLVEQSTPSQIIVTGSENSIAWPAPFTAAYNATKHAVLGMSGILRMELPEHVDIRVLCPGVVATGIATASASRPEKYGGPVASLFDGQEMPGMTAAEVANHTIKEIETSDDFIITTHYGVRYMAEERNLEVMQAFDRQTSEYEGWEQIDSRFLLKQAMEAAAEQ